MNNVNKHITIDLTLIKNETTTYVYISKKKNQYIVEKNKTNYFNKKLKFDFYLNCM